MNNLTDHLLFDGAFGTYYYALTGDAERCERAVLSSPDTVLRIHREYIAAGANAILTDTFSANPLTIPDRDELKRLLSAAFSTAVAAGDRARVFADIGRIAASEDGLSSEELAGHYVFLAEYFYSLGARSFMFETLDELTPVLPAVKRLKELDGSVTAAVSFAVSPDGYTEAGGYYRDLVEGALEYSDLSGLNCVCGPSHMYALLKKLVEQSGYDPSRLLAMPNSGYPVKLGGRLVYRDNPEYFADKLSDIARLGVRTLGGCCGTTPEHIRQTALRLGTVGAPPRAAAAVTPSPAEPKLSRLARLFESGRRVTAVELDPPQDADASFLVSSAAAIGAAGADVITLADAPLARARADSFMLAAKVLRETGVDTLPHLACRDRNRIAVKGALIAANIEGVSNVLAVTGDALPSACLHGEDDASGVFNFNSFKLISYIKSLNSELFTARPYLICGALNVNSQNFAAELKRAEKKIACGAEALFTQALFTDESLENLRLASDALDCRIMAGILPLASYRNAVFLNNEVSGITIPDEVIKSLEGRSPEETAELSLAYSRGLIDRASPWCDGFYLMTPLKKVCLVAELVKYIKSAHAEVVRTAVRTAHRR